MVRPDLIDDVPVPPDGAARARASGARRVRARRRAGITAMAAGVVLVVLGSVVAGDDRGGDLSTVAAPGTTGLGGSSIPAVGRAVTDPVTGSTVLVPDPPRPVDLAPPLLDLPPAALDAHPEIPAGWVTVVFGLAQLAIPPDWVQQPGTTPLPCGPGARPTLLLGPQQVNGTMAASAPCATPGTAMRLQVQTEPCVVCGDSIELNGMVFTDSADRCGGGCWMRILVGDLQLRLDYPFMADTGANAQLMQQIMKTLTPSGLARALAAGPTVDTTGWQPMSQDGVTFSVPPDWGVQHVTPERPSPTACSSSPFPQPSPADPTPAAVVLLGDGRADAQCLVREGAPPRSLADGVWVRSAQFTMGPEEYDVHLADGVHLVRPDLPGQVTLSVPTASGSTYVTVGLGPADDPAIARTVLRTIDLVP